MPEAPEGIHGGHGQKESMTIDDPADAVNSNLQIIFLRLHTTTYL